MRGTKLSEFTDLLIELADPFAVDRFRRDPSDWLRGKTLSGRQVEALTSGNAMHVRYFAMGGENPDDGDPDTQAPTSFASLDIITVATNSQINVAVRPEEDDPEHEKTSRPEDRHVFIGTDSRAYVIASPGSMR